MIKVLDKSHQVVGLLSDYKDLKIESTVADGDKVLSFTLLDKDFDILCEYYIQTEHDEFVVKEINQTSDGFPPSVVAALNLEELEQEQWENFILTEATTIATAARTVLQGTGYTIGECTVTKERTAGMVMCNTRAVIVNLCTAFMCEPVFDTINKTVSFYEYRGSDKGAYLMSGLNLKKLSKKSSSYDLRTRIIPIGANGLDITSVNGGKNYLENYQYTSKILPYIWKADTYTDATALKEDAELYLADLSKPEVSYSVDLLDLAKQSEQYDVLSYELGDNILLIDSATGTREKQRIKKLVEYPDEWWRNSAEIGNTTLTFEELQQKYNAAMNIVNYAMDSSGNYTGKISVSEILHFEEGVAATDTVAGINTNIQTLNGQYSNLSIKVGEIDANYISADEASITYATIANLNALTGNFNTLSADYATFKSTTTEEIGANTAMINNLDATAARITFANVDTANIDKAVMGKLLANIGLIDSAVIEDGHVTGYLDAVKINANSIQAGTLDAGLLTVVNLNAESITVGKINGHQIATNTIDSGNLTTTLNDLIEGAAQSVTVEYALSNSTTTAPTSGWSVSAPDWTEGMYMWQRTTTLYGDGTQDQTVTCIAGAQGQSGEDAVLLRIDSSRGTLFKNNSVATVLSVTIFHGETKITNRSELIAEFGSAAYLQWYWQRFGETTWSQISQADSRLSDGGFHFTITAADVDTKVSFQCDVCYG